MQFDGGYSEGANFWKWFDEYTDGKYTGSQMFSEIDMIFGTEFMNIPATRKVIMDLGIRGEELVEYMNIRKNL